MKSQQKDKKDYEVFSFINGYYGICKKDTHGGECIYGGDSANEDDYNKEYIQDVFNQWNGTLFISDDLKPIYFLEND